MPNNKLAWRAGRFWWDTPRAPQSIAADKYPLRALVFDLDALADIECAGYRRVFNAAFAAHGLDISWSEVRYRRLLTLSDERQRVVAELRAHSLCTESDVLLNLLADEIQSTKEMVLEEMILDTDIAPRAGLIDLVTDAFTAGVSTGVVSTGQRRWVEPLVRHLVGDGLVEVLVTADDLARPTMATDNYQLVLADLGIAAKNALAITGSAAGLRAAAAAGMATMVVGTDPEGIRGAAEVRADYDGDQPVHIADCQRLLECWWAGRNPSAA
ncbi:HAD family hydrolase [Mycobacteroides abscessus]|uniref:HAD family hydrolase n=1 Tax=Mycobacteroides abscessus TaxID=36809 RepID=UPI0018779126|nr:HAD family hydrolase [Mycobacteroides abscessus]MBE5441044.1 hypothetical protein [Mycobacteroides abscessus]